MAIGDTGAPWTVADARAVGRADWVQVGALTRADFPADVLAALARDRRVALDGQALVRPPGPGPLVLDADFDPAVLEHVTALKLNEEEVEALGGEERVAELGVPELLLTHGSTGGVVIARGVRERIPVRRDPDHESDRSRRRLPRRLRLGARRRPPARVGRAPRRHDRGAGARAGVVIALVRTVEGVFELDVESEDVLGEVDVGGRPRAPGARAAAARGRGGERRDRRRARRPAAAAPDLGRRRRDLARGRRRAARRASTSRSTRPIPTACSTPPATGSTSPPTAAASGARSRPSSRTSRRSRGLRNLELAARDGDGRAADLDRLDRVAGARRPRVERRGPADLRALLDLDLLAPRDEPVPAEVARERARRRAGRGVLADAVERARTSASSSSSPSPRRSAPTRSSSASAPMSGLSAATSSFDGQRDVGVPDAVVVDLDRQLGRARRRAPRAARPPGRTARPSAPAASSGRRRSARTRPARARRGRSRRPVSSAITPSCSGAPSTNAVPRHGCPANGSSLRGVKIRIRTVPPSRGGRTKTVSERPSSSASSCIVTSSRSRASVKTASWLPASGRSVKTSART